MSIKTLTKSDITNAVYEKSGKSRHETARLVNALLSVMRESIRADGSLLFSGFGKFDAYAKKSVRGRNLKTGESIVLPAHVKVVFRPSKVFKNELNA